MLIGEYRHTIDDKRRVAIPAGFRKEIGKKVVVTRGLDNCLFVYPLAMWQKVADRLSGLSMGQADTRSFSRFMLAGAIETEVDSMGRILVPDFLKDFASLKQKVVIAGIHDRLEIWDEARWKEHTERIEKQADVLAQKLGEIGVF
ncbi:MAG TPA: division/cell wall cluster transcriptional repressor MraZ [Candidatus Paceibacterota bacterium]|nr:division/cell wall cluster transcriptional repressor MraZ [Candidatus Paceibacterota bacterium]